METDIKCLYTDNMGQVKLEHVALKTCLSTLPSKFRRDEGSGINSMGMAGKVQPFFFLTTEKTMLANSLVAATSLARCVLISLNQHPYSESAKGSCGNQYVVIIHKPAPD